MQVLTEVITIGITEIRITEEERQTGVLTEKMVQLALEEVLVHLQIEDLQQLQEEEAVPQQQHLEVVQQQQQRQGEVIVRVINLLQEAHQQEVHLAEVVLEVPLKRVQLHQEEKENKRKKQNNNNRTNSTMKIFITITLFFAATIVSYTQSLNYQELGMLFSQDENNGSARFTAMSGAFGALGGDVSAMNINPAGLSIFNNSSFLITFNQRATETLASYGNAKLDDGRRTTINRDDGRINLPYAGAVLALGNTNDPDWSKVAFGFNYKITKDFLGSFSAKGKEAVTRFYTNPDDTNDPKILYDSTFGQSFDTKFKGELTELNFALSGIYKKNICLGLGLNFYDLDFSQESTLTEFNSDANENELDVELYQDNFTTGEGFSANLGFIYKASNNFRFGLAYQTPIIYREILQDTNYDQDSDTDFGKTTFFPGGGRSFSESNDRLLIEYGLRTPGKLTASAAIIFGKNGLLSFDYINKNYQNLELTSGDFPVENKFFQDELRDTHTLNAGTEWRFDRLSVRGGYKFEQNPYKAALDSDNLKGYSFGWGYDFGGFKLDFAYNKNNSTSFYNIYSQEFEVDSIELETENSIFTTTIVFNY